MIRLLLAVLVLTMNLITTSASAEEAAQQPSFYQTSFVVQDPWRGFNWNSLGFNGIQLRAAVSALTGDRFAARPPEWGDYIDTWEMEDEDPTCLNAPDSWRLVAGRAVPIEFDTQKPFAQLRLTFQPYCRGPHSKVASDTSIQMMLSIPTSVLSPRSGTRVNESLMKMVQWLSTRSSRSERKARIEDAGFVSTKEMKTIAEFPTVLDSKEMQSWMALYWEFRNSGSQLNGIQWMASLAGQLDWVFGSIEVAPVTGELKPLPIRLRDANDESVVDLGPFDFLPLVLREPYQALSPEAQDRLNARHVREDLHDGKAAAQRVLAIDLLVSDANRTRHDQASCIQCHSAQERIRRAQDFLRHGGAKDFGYFFRGLGRIDDQAFVSWRSVQESKLYSEKIRRRLDHASPNLLH